MGTIKSFALAGLMGGAVAATSGLANAEDIRGPIVRTLILSEDTTLVGHVTCTVEGTPCIAFGAPGITLYLNGFTVTGLANATTGCGGTSVVGEFGISTNNQHDVAIRGPGLVQRFRNSGIFFMGTVRGRIEGVTASTNCISGIQVNATSSSIMIEGNVLVRNGMVSGGVTGGGRGGITINGGSNNVIRRNETSGNGYADPPDDHGIGVVAGNNNLIEENTAMGNTNGIGLFAASTGNIVRGNVVVGNPPIQVSVSLPATTGVDILNLSAPGTSIFERNVCLTAVSAACPDLSTYPIPRRPQN
jgi:parallel beta-helix repeat protein